MASYKACNMIATYSGCRPVKSLQITAGLRPVKNIANHPAAAYATAGYEACNMLKTGLMAGEALNKFG
jgi:hypothetical protein